jgi:PAS domain S-box-containing protein
MKERAIAGHVMSASTKLFSSGQPDNALRRENERLKAENERLREKLDGRSAEIAALKARFARYETVLRGSRITVFTQDRALHYTSISNSLCGHSENDILGRTDLDLFPGRAAEAMSALKREVLESGEQRRGEVPLQDSSADRWFDLHIEPLRDESGTVDGVACAAIDISKRKEDEAHLRLLLRELTHRSKNLLAVIQGMARQTGRHAGSIHAFLTQFSGRLQSLAAAHDLLVRESWHGASMQELARAQLSAYFGGEMQRVSMQGPAVGLKPEAAQSLGLALHELAGNATRFGALSVEQGRVALTWERAQTPRKEALVVDWREEAGPPVKARRKRGFGSMALERHLAAALEADVTLDFDPDGLRCRIVIPAKHLLPRDENAARGR